jgi:hypothetical protein
MDLCLTARFRDAAVIAGFSLPVVMMVKESVNRAFRASFGLEDQKEGMAGRHGRLRREAQGEFQEPLIPAIAKSAGFSGGPQGMRYHPANLAIWVFLSCAAGSGMTLPPPLPEVIGT